MKLLKTRDWFFPLPFKMLVIFKENVFCYPAAGPERVVLVRRQKLKVISTGSTPVVFRGLHFRHSATYR